MKEVSSKRTSFMEEGGDGMEFCDFEKEISNLLLYEWRKSMFWSNGSTENLWFSVTWKGCNAEQDNILTDIMEPNRAFVNC